MPSPVYNNYANIITFSRGTNATLTDSTGKITYAPANLVLYSQTLTNAYWGTVGSSIATTSAVTDPNGATGAFLFTEDSSTGRHLLGLASAQTAPTTFISSLYVRKKDKQYVTLTFVNSLGNGWVSALFDLNSGTYLDNQVVNGGTTQSFIAATITSAGNSWYRLSITGTTTSANGFVTFAHANASTFAAMTIAFGNPSYTGDGTSGTYLWGAQFEPTTYKTTPSTYVATTTAAYYGPRLDYDPVTLAVKGLLVEEARTNLATYSQDFSNAAWTKQEITITTSAGTAPDGTNTANNAVPTTLSSTHQIASGALVASSACTISVYAKNNGYNTIEILDRSVAVNGASFNLTTGAVTNIGSGVGSAVSVGNGWWRCIVSVTTTGIRFYIPSSSASFSGNGTSGVLLWGAQLEAGAFATSYIPTVAASVARSADIASMTGSQFAPWYNPNAGTLVGVGTTFNASGGTFLFNMRDSSGTSANEYSMYQTGTAPVWLGNSGAVNQFTITPAGSVTNNTPFKLAGTYSANDFAAAFNSGAVATDTSGATATGQDRAWVGARNGATNFANGHIQTITYYPRRLSNSQLQSLTS